MSEPRKRRSSAVAPAEILEDDLDDSEYHEVTEDIYSLIYTAKARGAAFWYALFVFAFQMTIILLILADLLDTSSSTNPLQIPPGVVTEVRIAQSLALLLAMATQQDVLTALIFIHTGYSRSVLNTIPAATRSKWALAGISHMIAGGSMLVVLFILMMQSTQVISLFLNFAALAFVSEIDDAGFIMAKHGFITDSIQRETKRVLDMKVPQRSKSNVFRRVMLLLIFAALMGGYAYVVASQIKGKFLPQSLRAQFGDEFAPFLPLFSGVYIQTNKLAGGRVMYEEEETKLGRFAYCPQEKAWTFSIGDATPCRWLAKSPETLSFDITSTVPSEWLVLTDQLSSEPSKSVQIPFFSLSSNDCHNNPALCVSGICQDNKCVCDEERYGLRCEFSEPCSLLQVDFRTPPFPNDFGRVQEKFDLLKHTDGIPVQVYHRPVYAFDHGGFWDIVMFQGRRWVLTSSDSLKEIGTVAEDPSDISREDLAIYLDAEYNGLLTQVLSFFISEPMDVDTPTDAYTPVGLRWYRIKTNVDAGIDFNEIDETQALQTAMLCAVCNNMENRCYSDGICNEGACECPEDYSGSLCEFNPAAAYSMNQGEEELQEEEEYSMNEGEEELQDEEEMQGETNA